MWKRKEAREDHLLVSREYSDQQAAEHSPSPSTTMMESVPGVSASPPRPPKVAGLHLQADLAVAGAQWQMLQVVQI